MFKPVTWAIMDPHRIILQKLQARNKREIDGYADLIDAHKKVPIVLHNFCHLVSEITQNKKVTEAIFHYKSVVYFLLGSFTI